MKAGRKDDYPTPDEVRALSPLGWDQAGRDRWALIVPERIASECSPKHVQSVLEDAQATIADQLKVLRYAARGLAHLARQVDRTKPDQLQGAPLREMLTSELAGLAMHAMAAASRAAGVVIAPATVLPYPLAQLEVIAWYRTSAGQLPELGADVWLSYGDETPAFWGAYLGDGWVGPEGEHLARVPEFYAQPARGPLRPQGGGAL